MDAKDILGLHKTSFPSSIDKKSRPPKESQRKPDGISREVYALTGGMPSLMPAIDASQLKKKPSPNEKVTWQWLPFTNSARKDDLHLYHWVRIVNGVLPSGDSSFAKYNKSVDIIKYTDEEYEKYLTDPMWTKEETNELFDLCERFDLRFDRYYSVLRAILLARAASSGDVATYPLIKEQYNVSQEMERKRALSMVLSQTRQQEKRDEEVLIEAKRIAKLRMASKVTEQSQLVVATNADAEVTERAVPSESLSPSNVQHPPMVAPSPFQDNASTLASLRMLRVYLRTYALEQMVQASNSSAGVRTIKRVEQTLQDLGVNLKPRVPTKAVCAEHLELRREILTWLNLQKQVQYKEAEDSSFRDGTYGETPGTPKDRTFIPDSLNFGVSGERVGKKDQKHKGHGAQPTAAHKRPRKQKASDL
ncbi:SWR1-complex protein [Trifolium repens]|nr:SWR1-complex protein [Trifolium repens]